jgi:transposase InsO family protein
MFIKAVGGEVAILCSIAGVSRSGYYAWKDSQSLPDRDHPDHIAIKAIFDRSNQTYGWRRIKNELPSMNHKKIQRIMRKYGLVSRIRKKNPYKQMMKRKQEETVFPNVLQRAFTQDTPYTVYSTDITYLPLGDSFAYLSAMKDVASGEIVSFKTSLSIDMALVLDTVSALPEAMTTGALIHSDQGFQYTNHAYRKLIESRNMVASMSAKGTCLDNAPIESFFGHMKDEIVYDKRNATYSELTLIIAKYMRYYNHERKQWGRNRMTPVAYREHLLTR